MAGDVIGRPMARSWAQDGGGFQLIEVSCCPIQQEWGRSLGNLAPTIGHTEAPLHDPVLINNK